MCESDYTNEEHAELDKTAVSLMDPAVTGSAFWFILHSICATFRTSGDTPSEAEQDEVKKKIKNLIDMMICIWCKLHAYRYLARTPIDASNRDRLFEWSRTFHNELNRRGKKPQVSRLEAIRNLRTPLTAVQSTCLSDHPFFRLLVYVCVILGCAMLAGVAFSVGVSLCTRDTSERAWASRPPRSAAARVATR